MQDINLPLLSGNHSSEPSQQSHTPSLILLLGIDTSNDRPILYLKFNCNSICRFTKDSCPHYHINNEDMQSIYGNNEKNLYLFWYVQ